MTKAQQLLEILGEKLVGEYTNFGYKILTSNGDEIYSAGNSPHDSQVTVSKKKGLSLKTIKDYCNQTGKELAAERGTTYGGCSFDQDGDEELSSQF